MGKKSPSNQHIPQGFNQALQDRFMVMEVDNHGHMPEKGVSSKWR